MRLSLLLLLPTCALSFTVSKDFVKGLQDGVGIPTAQHPRQLDDLVNGSRPREDNVYQGDIVLTPEKVRHFRMSPKEVHRRSKRNALKGGLKWENNTVYYYFDNVLGPQKRLAVQNAIALLQARTCINFVESKTAQFRIKITNGDGCQTRVGKAWEGEGIMTLADGCGVVYTNVAHEFMHSLGMTHTQSRSDRDNYITVNDKGGAFEGQNDKKDTENYVPYEYAIKKTPNALAPKDSRYDYTLGSKLVSFYDIMMINEYYECPGCARCKNGGVQNVRDCFVCECPAGFGGKECDQRPEGCGSTLTATETWQTEVITVGTAGDVKDVYDKCNTWITAPQGKLIEVKTVEMQNSNCNYGCTLNGIEIKGDKDIKITNPRHCCDESIEKVIQSYQNPTPVITHARAGPATFTIMYRYSVECEDIYPTYCQNNPDFCSSDESFREKKYQCGVTCGLCGQKNPVCEDDPTCAEALEYHTCADLLKGGYEVSDLEYVCRKSCGFCGNTTTTSATTTTTVTTTTVTTTTAPKPSENSTNPVCQEKTSCDKAFADIVEGNEKDYFCGNHCASCMETQMETCEDSKFCAKLMKESGGTCDTLWDYIKQDRDLYNFYCFKSCGGLC